MNTINKTSIIFDDNLKQLIKDFVNNRVSKIDFKSSKLDFEIKQDELRKHMDIEIFPKLTNNIKPSKPNYYTIFILILLNDYLDGLKSWNEFNEIFDDLNDEFEKNKSIKTKFKTNKLKLNYKVLVKESDDIKTYFTCCCGQNNCSGDNLGILKNYNNQYFMFGSKCITKTGINFVSFCKKNTRLRDEYNESVNMILGQTLFMSRKYHNKPLSWIINNDKNYLIFLYSKGLFNKPEYKIIKQIIEQKIINK
jgi:hypothetical protein